jgi:hypothetical protein
MHGFVTRDGMDPNTFRAIARDQLRAYPNVHFEMAEATRIGARAGVSEFETGNEATQSTRKVLLATGVFDQLPDLPGIEPLFGTSFHSCPSHGPRRARSYVPTKALIRPAVPLSMRAHGQQQYNGDGDPQHPKKNSTAHDSLLAPGSLVIDPAVISSQLRPECARG